MLFYLFNVVVDTFKNFLRKQPAVLLDSNVVSRRSSAFYLCIFIHVTFVQSQ